MILIWNFVLTSDEEARGDMSEFFGISDLKVTTKDNTLSLEPMSGALPDTEDLAIRVLLGVALFGVFWGAWGPALPAVQTRTRVGDAAFGGALLLIGVGALASMRLTAHVLDKFGRQVIPVIVLGFVGCVLAAGSATSALTVSIALLALGYMSGAFHIVVNAAAVAYESMTQRQLVGGAHAASPPPWF